MVYNSVTHAHIIHTTVISKSKHSVDYAFKHANSDDVIMRCPIFDSQDKPEHIIQALEAYTYEIQTMKALGSHYLPDIKEEIFEYNPQANFIARYVAILEEERYSFNDVLKIWNDEES